MNKKTLIITVSITLLLIGVAVAYIFISKPAPETVEITSNQHSSDGIDTQNVDPNQSLNDPQTVTRTAPELNEAIIDQRPSLVSSGKATYDIIDIKRVEDAWYIVKIKSNTDSTVGVAWIVLKDEGAGGLVVAAGPGTAFPDSVPIPASVRKAIK